MTTARARLLSTTLTRVVLPFALLTAVMLGLGFLITHVLVHVWPFVLEDEAVRALVAARSPTLDRVSDVVSQAGYIVGLTATMLVAGCAMRLVFHRWREWLFLAAALLSQGAVYEVTVAIVTRARPPVAELDHFPPMRSFFSGHTSAAVAVYLGIAVVLARHARRPALAGLWWVILLIIPVAVAVSRVYRGMHYPSDVAAGFIVGFGCLWILQRVMLTPPEPGGSLAV